MSRVTYHFGIVCLLRKGFPLPTSLETPSLSGDSSSHASARIAGAPLRLQDRTSVGPVPPFYALQSALLPCPHRDRVHQHSRSLTTHSSVYPLGLALRDSLTTLALQRSPLLRLIQAAVTVAEYVDDLASPTQLLLPFEKVVVYAYETLHQCEMEY